MLKKISIISIILLSVFLFTGLFTVYAGESMTITGKVKDVDLDDRSLVLGMEDGDQVFYIEENTRIFMDENIKELKDITIGMVIEVFYNESGDDNIIFKINIVS